MVRMPEIKIEPLQPIDFGQSDEDRVKDMFEKVFLVEYELSRNGYGIESSMDMASSTANEAAKLYRRWLKAQEHE